MRNRHETSKALFVIIRYALAQLGFWFCLKQILTWKQDILWFIAIPSSGFILLTVVIPYIAARAIQRRTMLGYFRSRNGAFVAHAGLGLMLSLQLFDLNHYVIPGVVILLGLLVIADGLMHPSAKGTL